MWEPSNLVEKKFNEETHRLIGEAQLHEFGIFLDRFNEITAKNTQTFRSSISLTLKPILLDERSSESLSIIYLTRSDNKILARILSSLGGICQEVDYLKNEAEQLYSSFVFCEEENGRGLENIESMSKLIEPLQKVQCFVSRVRDIIIFTIKQLCAILHKGFYVTGNTSSFPEVLNCFADLLVCLLKLDSLLDLQINKEHWFLYRRSIRNIAYNHAKYDCSKDDLQLFDKTLVCLEHELLSGRILKDTIEKCLQEKLILEVKRCSLKDEFFAFLLTRINDLEKDEEHILYTKLWLQLNVLVVFYFNIFENTDKKFIKRLLDLNKKSSACNLVGNIVWYPEQFLLKHVQSLAKFIDEKAIESYRLNQIQYRSQNLNKESNTLCLQACCFLVEIDKIAKINASNLKVRQLQHINVLLIDGLRLIKKISSTVTWIMTLHVDKNLPVTKTVLLAVTKLIEILKAIFLTLKRHIMPIVYLILLTSQQLSHKALSILHSIRKNLTQEKSYKTHELDVLSALNVCENALKGPNSQQRLLVANLAISASGISSYNLFEIRSVLVSLNFISSFTTMVENISNCSFLYWHQNYVLPVYFSKLLSSKTDISVYYLMLSAISDCISTGGDKLVEPINRVLKENFFGPVNQIVETNLRLQTHLHLQLPRSDPFENCFSLNFNKQLPVPMYKYYKNIKMETEHYLSMMFYNLTTVILHDWKTYGEMRKLAALQYGLNTVDDDLPMQTLDQGLDVLEIMRNINVFVQKYLYNLNSQVFIEESSNNKHLNSINISHVANSIRTHGIGIMNTTVNFTYQFLRNKFYVFSQFMFDEHIKSRLLKDLRFFNEHKIQLMQMYPYERAEKFNVGIRKLGLNQNGESYLDLFRKVITHIGNAMGYIRLIRSGGRRCLADGTCFIPNLKDADVLKDILKDEEISDMSKNALGCLLQDLNNFLDNFEEATEYFQLLVSVLVPVFRNKNNMHLKNFYIIIPPLTINFIEHSLTCKEKLNKRNKAECAFTDDGFALGLAYIVELLDQEGQVNSLHWFHSVQKKFKNDRQKIKEQTTLSNSDDTKLKQTLTLTEKRIFAFEREFQLLYYSYSSARLFFQS